MIKACCGLPFHGDLVVAFSGKRDPVDAASVVGGVDLSQEQHAALFLTRRFKLTHFTFSNQTYQTFETLQLYLHLAVKVPKH